MKLEFRFLRFFQQPLYEEGREICWNSFLFISIFAYNSVRTFKWRDIYRIIVELVRCSTSARSFNFSSFSISVGLKFSHVNCHHRLGGRMNAKWWKKRKSENNWIEILFIWYQKNKEKKILLDQKGREWKNNKQKGIYCVEFFEQKSRKNCENLKEIFLSLRRYQTDYRMKAVGESELMKKVIKDSLSFGSQKTTRGRNV